MSDSSHTSERSTQCPQRDLTDDGSLSAFSCEEERGSLPGPQIHLAEQLWSSCTNKSHPICHTSDGKPFENGWSFKAATSSIRNKSNKLILRDGRKKFLAVIYKESMTPLVSSFKVYSPTPITTTQSPTKKVSHSRVVLYEWAEVISIRHKARNTMCVWNGTEHEKILTSEKDITAASERVTFRKKGRPAGKMNKSLDKCSKTKDLKWSLDLQSPEDTVLLLCFAAIIDELNQEESDEMLSLQQQAKSVEGIVRRSMAADDSFSLSSGQREGQGTTPSTSSTYRRSSWESTLSSKSSRSPKSSRRSLSRLSSTRSVDSSISLTEYLSSQFGDNQKQPSRDTPPCA